MRLNVAYSTDENYAKHACVSMVSLFEHNKNFDIIHVYIIDNNITIETKKKFLDIAKKYNRDIEFISFDILYKGLALNDKYPASAYARLSLSRISEINKILYLDCDTIINYSLEELWNINIDSYLIAGVHDNPKKYMVSIIGMNENHKYINSGVLLINLEEWRKIKIENNFIDFIKKYKGEIPHEDQGVINGVCKDRILIIEPKFNMMPQMIYMSSEKIKKLATINQYYSQEELNDAIERPVIIHYTGLFYNRPWNKSCDHPYKNEYIRYLKKIDFNCILENRKLKKGVKIRKFIYFNMPFFIYVILENILDIKRKRPLKIKYSYLGYKI